MSFVYVRIDDVQMPGSIVATKTSRHSSDTFPKTVGTEVRSDRTGLEDIIIQSLYHCAIAVHETSLPYNNLLSLNSSL